MPVDKKPENFIETIKDIFRRLSLLEINSSSGGGTGAVDSVNGLTGVVVLNQDNILDGTTNKQYSSTEKTKLAGIESGADITDTANVTSAGALMDSEVDQDIKTLSLPAGTTISSFGASLISETTSSDARISLGVDPAGTDNSTDVSLAGVYNYLTIVGQVITLAKIDLTTDVTGLLPTANVANLSGTNTGDNAGYEPGGTDVAVVDGGTGSSTSAGARTNLDVDQSGTDNSTNVSLAGTPDYLTLAGQIITLGLIDLANDVTGNLPTSKVSDLSGVNTGDQVIPVKAIGTELDTGTDDAKFATSKAIKDSKNVPSVVPGTSGNVLTSDGTNWQSSTPTGGTGGVSVLEVQVFS